MYEIEENVPYLNIRTTKLYPFADMHVGQSFAAPTRKKANIRAAVHKFVERSARAGVHFRFMTRLVRENGEEKIRVWRIE